METLILGIDDAGRGPVIGPMVLAGCLIDLETEKHFKKLGVKDSKMLTSNRRETLVKEIKNKARAFEITLTSPVEIDKRSLTGLNLNKIEAIKSAEIINKIVEKLNIEKIECIKVIIDCPSPNISAWKNFLMKYIDEREKITVSCEHKADKNHIACSAASIIAKTTRDAEIEKIKEKIGIDFGSGYTSDPYTVEFLDKNFKKHKNNGIFRETWGTVQEFKAKKQQKKLGDFKN